MKALSFAIIFSAIASVALGANDPAKAACSGLQSYCGGPNCGPCDKKKGIKVCCKTDGPIEGNQCIDCKCSQAPTLPPPGGKMRRHLLDDRATPSCGTEIPSYCGGPNCGPCDKNKSIKVCCKTDGPLDGNQCVNCKCSQAPTLPPPGGRRRWNPL